MDEQPGRRLGIDVGGTKCLGVVLDRFGGIVAETRRPTPYDPYALLDVLAEIVGNLERVDRLAGDGGGRGTRADHPGGRVAVVTERP